MSAHYQFAHVLLVLTPFLHFSDPFDQGCYVPNSESNKHGFNEANFISLHRYLTSSTDASVNILGTYNIPSACRRFCYAVKKSTISVIASHKCHCLNSDTELDDFISNTQSLDDEMNCANTLTLFSNNLQFGFSTLNFASNHEEDLPIRPNYCDSLDNQGIFKCGSNKDNEIHARVFGFTDFVVADRSFFNFSEISMKIDNDVVGNNYIKSVAVYKIFKVSVVYPFCSSPCYLSDDGGLCLCNNFPLWIQVTFGDGSEFVSYQTSFESTGLQLEHFYNKTGDYTIEFIARIKPGAFQTKKATLRVFLEAEQVIPNYIEAELSTPNQETHVTLAVLLGTEFSCSINYGDETLVETYHYNDVNEISTLKHRFRKPGLFTITADCSNLIRSESISSVALIQNIALGLQAPIDNVISHDDVYEHGWKLVQGSHATCKLFFGSRSIEEVSSAPDPNNIGEGSFYFDRDANQGNALIPIPDNEQHGIYSVVVVCYNALTQTLPFAISSLAFETPVDAVNLQYSASQPYFEENEGIELSLTVSSGSNFLIYWHWNDVEGGRDDVIEYCFKEECKSK